MIEEFECGCIIDVDEGVIIKECDECKELVSYDDDELFEGVLY